MNWFNIVNFILALAPQELALVKAIVDAAHVGHQSGTPLQPLQPAAVGIPSETAAPTEKEVLQK